MTAETPSRDQTLDAINDPKNRSRVIWTPSIVLERLGIGRYPNYPKHAYARAKDVLAVLCAEGILIRRSELHSHYTLRETAYMRPAVMRGRNVSPSIATHNAYLSGKDIQGVRFPHNAAVVVSRDGTDQLAWTVSIVRLFPETVYLVELEDGSDYECPQSDMRLAR